MKIECKLEKIKNAIIICERITGKNLTLPVLGSILFIAKEKNLILRSTNLSIGVEIKISAKIEKEGTVAINGQTLAQLFGVMSNEGDIKIELIDKTINIKTKNNNINLNTIPYDDFPTLPNVVGDKLKIQTSKLIEGIKSVYYSSSISDIKPEIGSVYLYKDDEDLVFVATDSFRLAEKRIKIKQNLDLNSILIPFKNTTEILRILENKEEDIDITVNKNQISFMVENIYITSRVVDGVFPDYKQIIPKDMNTEVVVLKQDLINAIKVSNIFSDKFNQVTLNIDPKEKVFNLYSKNNDIGENNTQISGVITGEKVSANFNYKYIIDSLQSIHTDSLSLSLSGSNKPMIIKPIGDKSFMYLVMSMNR